MLRTRKARGILVSAATLGAFLAVGLFVTTSSVRRLEADQRLVEAVKALDSPAVDRLLRDGADANAADRLERSTPMEALLELFSFHRNHPAPPVDADRCLALLTMQDAVADPAFTARADAIGYALVTHGARVDVQLSYTRTPLHRAAWAGLHRTVDALLEKGADPEARASLEVTPLFGADLYAAERLIQRGARPDGVDGQGRSPLFSSHGAGVAALLVLHGADVNRVDRTGRSVLDFIQEDQAATPERAVLVDYLRAHGALRGSVLRAQLKRSGRG